MRRWLFLLVLLLLVLPASALADVPAPERHGLVLDQVQLWSLVIGIFTPLVGYVINSALFKRVKAGIPEPVAMMVQVLVAAIGAGIYAAVAANGFGWNSETLQLVVTSVVAAFASHGMIWKPSGVQQRLVKRG